MIRILIFLAIFLACAWYAWRAGGQPERAAMLAQALALFITLSTGFLEVAGGFTTLVEGWVLADVFLVIALFWLALRANRIWTIVLAGLHLAAIFAHLTKLVYPDLPALGYAVFLQLWAYPMLLTTAIGVRKHQQRLLMQGADLDWKPRETRLTPVSF